MKWLWLNGAGFALATAYYGQGVSGLERLTLFTSALVALWIFDWQLGPLDARAASVAIATFARLIGIALNFRIALHGGPARRGNARRPALLLG